MPIAQKLAAAIFLPVCVVLILNAANRIDRESDQFESEIRRDHAVMGGALTSMLAAVWEREGAARALDLLDDARQVRGNVALGFHLEAELEPVLGSLDEGSRKTLHARQPLSRVEEPPGSAPAFVSYFPLEVHGQLVGVLTLAESLSGQEAHLRAIVLRVLVILFGLAMAAAGVSLVVGERLLARPIREVLAHAERLGAGELGATLPEKRHDELGALVHEMNRLSERLLATREALEEESQQKLATLEQLRHAERLLTVGKLASGIAHELGTPLHVVAARARRIKKREPAESESARDAQIVIDETARMSGIVRQLLDFARPQKAAPRPVELGALVRQAVSLVESHPDAKAARIEVSAASEPTSVVADPDGLVQVLTNVLVNGAQAMGEEGGVLEVVVDEVEAVPPGASGPARPFARIVVEDEGPGMAAEVLEHIFEPFFTTKEVGRGTGLGLSVAYGIVREHGGFIAVRSAPREGSRFAIHLPLDRAV